MSSTLPDNPLDVHLSAFVTCKECNALNPIDEKDVMPTCMNCGVALHFELGPQDLEKQVVELQQARKKEALMMKAATLALQCILRGFLARRKAKQLRLLKIERERQEKHSAIRAQAMFRGYLGRKVARVERALLRIKKAHTEIMLRCLNWDYDADEATTGPVAAAKAIGAGATASAGLAANARAAKASPSKKTLGSSPAGRPRRRHVFWYKNPADLELFYSDYRLYVERSGSIPPLRVVEANVLELFRRIDILEYVEAIKIQTYFRATIGRTMAALMLAERTRLASIRVACAISIQRYYRGWIAYRKLHVVRTEKRRGKLLGSYRDRAKAREWDAAGRAAAYSSMEHYKHEVRGARVGVFTGRFPFGAGRGRRLNGMDISGLSRADYPVAHAPLISRTAAKYDEAEADMKAAREYNDYVESRVSENPGLESYFTLKDPEPAEGTMQRATKEHGILKETVRAAKPNFKSVARHFPFAAHKPLGPLPDMF